MENLKKHSFAVLFVDDEDQTRKYFNMGLKAYFEIFTAASVAEAKEILASHGDKIGVVITDQRMPGGNGVELLRFLKSHYPRIVRLLATAYSDLAEAIEAVNSGEIFRYIQKPWKDFDALRMELSQAMELFETKQQRDELLKEKFTIRKKMTKIERIRMLVCLSNVLGFRFFAIQELLRILADGENQNEVIIKDLDFGKEDVLEARFQMDLAEKIKNKINLMAGKTIDKAFIAEFLKVELVDDCKFKINLNAQNNFLISGKDILESDECLNLLVLCLVLDKENSALDIDFDNGVLSCKISKDGGKDVVDNLENIIFSALL